MPRWGNRLAKAGILVAVLGVVGGTGYLAGTGGATPPVPMDPLPAADLSPKTITVGTGTIVSRLNVDAVVRADPPVPVKATRSGTVAAVHRRDGQLVGRGESLLSIKVPGKGKDKTVAVLAPVAGRVSGLAATVGQEITPAEPVAQLDQRRFQAVATIDAKEVYRLYNRPKEIKLAIDHGPEPFRCRLLAYGAGASSKPTAPQGQGGPQQPPAPGTGDGDGGGGGGGENVEVTCRIPAHQRVFAGIRAKMAITTDRVDDAVVVPLSAVLGQASKGRVTVVGEDGSRQTRKVELGVNDGKQVEIVSGLKEGDRILDRAPDDAAFDVPPAPQGGPEEGPTS
ncbi:hypothetical protein GCM10009678_05700 [Actinomadura kijaniata]|uniref:Multidrug efflux pump subunit AcrA (Membrane-fusion protein) n=1 Tax=Actinomadura namibiensis TaxID=182080 RepID=A0A7W3LLQ4_ACTNM|nr:HlyD family efflux transporter periplasmic adaptor subunit [Actinomadura namibiensis]MBA8950465.1 multidrug efflux pump subunit AcrA (membrane-fusion protein) [Actinomadura namibiensis]